MEVSLGKTISFKVMPYALAHVLLALKTCNINEYVLTLEDGELVVRIETSEVSKSVYGSPKGGSITCNGR